LIPKSTEKRPQKKVSQRRGGGKRNDFLKMEKSAGFWGRVKRKKKVAQKTKPPLGCLEGGQWEHQAKKNLLSSDKGK